MKIKEKKQLEQIKNINADSKSLKKISFFSRISEKAKKIMDNIKIIDDWLETTQLICTKTDGKTQHEFNKFTLPLKFTSKIYQHDLTLQKAEDDQQELKILINKLNKNYNPRNKTKIKEKDDTLESANKLYSIREDIVDAFSKGIFSYIDGFQVEKETDKETNEQPDTTNMPEFESEESAEERRNQPGKGLKILTPSQMLSRLPIILAQLKAGNNSEKPKNETREYLYRSKNVAKQVYNNLIKYI